ncbi:MAG: hypothetical protein QOF69_3573 [Solirubrobacteraceae bacterium]|nr:hypothetical protein [Solirubrobacteraceae bacterium]
MAIRRETMGTTAKYSGRMADERDSAAQDRDARPVPAIAGNLSVRAQIVAECQAMASYALASGLRVSSSALHSLADADEPVPARLDAQQWRRLVQAHDQLVQVVSPATPRALLLLSTDGSDGKLHMLGGVPLVRRMLGVSVASLAVFLLTALSPKVSHASGDIFHDSGTDLLINELFLLSAAGIGAAFAALFAANHYVSEGTYDPKYEASYWVRFVLGLIAGIVLASLIPIESSANGGASFTKPFLALLGGFSAAVVFRILQRVVGTLESLVQGDSSDGEAAKKRLASSEASQLRTQDQMRVSASLVKLREQLASGAPPAQSMALVGALLDEMLPVDTVGSGSSPTEAEPRPAAQPVNGATGGSAAGA